MTSDDGRPILNVVFPVPPSTPTASARSGLRGRPWGSALALCLLLLTLSCAPRATYSDGIFRQGDVAFRTGPLSDDWSRIGARGARLAFRHRQGGTLIVNAECPARDEAPLDVLTNHLLFGLAAKKEAGRRPLTLDGREALRTELVAELDGVPVALDLVVLKKDGCLYDLQLVAGPTILAARQPDFTSFVSGFATLAVRPVAP